MHNGTLNTWANENWIKYITRCFFANFIVNVIFQWFKYKINYPLTGNNLEFIISIILGYISNILTVLIEKSLNNSSCKSESLLVLFCIWRSVISLSLLYGKDTLLFLSFSCSLWIIWRISFKSMLSSIGTSPSICHTFFSTTAHTLYNQFINMFRWV